MKTIRETSLKNVILRLVEKDKVFIGIVIFDGKKTIQIQGPNADEVWRQLQDEAGKASPKYFGFKGARNRFLHFFTGGFQSNAYVEQEREYKIAAKLKLDVTAPLDKAASGSGFGEAVLAAFRQTNLLSPFEKIRVQEALRGPNADAFIQAAARFTLDQGKSALLDMEHALKPNDIAKWTVVSYLPFLWRPDEHMFLKPEVTKDFAERVGHRFATDYEPRLDIAVYDSLLNLAAKTTNELADLNPRDRIDIQSFIWVVGDYDENSERPFA